MKLVVVGLGSIGKRHSNNLKVLGHEVISCHRNDNLKKILEKEKPDGVLVCNPTSMHLKPAMTAAEAGVNIFVEKPISHNLKGIDKLLATVKKKKLILMVGYNLRFEPELAKIKKQLSQKSIGKIKLAKIFVGSYLPDWHPNEDHRQSYSAKKDLGGGVLLDLSHEINYAIWFFGKAKTVKAKLKKAAELEIETEAVADLEVEFESGVKAQIHLDYVSREHKRSLEVKGDKGFLNWDYAAIKNSGWDSNEMYVEEIKSFIQAIKEKNKPRISGDEAKHVLEIIEAAKESSKSGAMVKL